MESFAKPIRALVDALSWFVRAREVRLLHIATSPDLRAAVLRLSAAQELHAENRSPFVVLEDPFTKASEGWLERVERLRAQHEQRKSAMIREGESLPDLPERPSASEPFIAFAAQLAQLLLTRADWHEGLTVLLAPTRVEDPGAWTARLRALLSADGLDEVRWVVVEPDAITIDPLLEELGQRAMRVVCRVDEGEAQRDLARMLDAAESAPPDISGPARVGAAWPSGVSPPPRADRPSADPEAIEAILKEEGVSLPLAGSQGTALSRAVLRAAQALRRGHVVRAVEEQARARDLCLELGLPRETVLMELVLGAYLVHAGDRRLAIATYAKASERAGLDGLGDLGAQAQMALGALYLQGEQTGEAAVAYAKGGNLARQHGSALLAIEGFRRAGQIRLDLGDEEQAAELWRTALEIARAATTSEERASSASEAALALAALYRRRGLAERALQLEEQSRKFESVE